MKALNKKEITEYHGCYICSTWREKPEGEQQGTVMCIAYSDAECETVMTDDKDMIVAHIAPKKEKAMKMICKKIDKQLEKGA